MSEATNHQTCIYQLMLTIHVRTDTILFPAMIYRVRILTTVFIVLASVFILRQWPEVRDIGSHVMKHLKDMLDPVK